MIDGDIGTTTPLCLRDAFPPVSTQEWESAIARDLKGADYEKKLLVRTEDGLVLRPYYRQEDLRDLAGHLNQTPGQFPYLRGSGSSWQAAQDLAHSPDAIRADRLHEAGAHAVQELGYALAAGVERLAAIAGTEPLEAAASQVEFVFAAGPDFFVEIAKLRAARVLWAQIVQAFDPSHAVVPRPMRIHVRTPLRNKSGYDRYSNLLRVTTETLSAVIGGCDRLTVDPAGIGAHMASGVQRLAREEAHLDAVADPAGGSYFIEALTASLAQESWKVMQEVEAEGGFAAALASGSMEKALSRTRQTRAAAYASRRRTLVGVNHYPNLAEKDAGIDLPPSGRIAEPFERIRRRTAAFAAENGGRYPKVLLLERGDVAMRGARSNFCLNFFGCAGFDIAVSSDYEGTAASLVILCSSDSEYLPLAKEVCPALPIPVLVAGKPKEQEDALRAAGVQGFVHLFSDAVATLTEWQDRLGMRGVQ